MNLTPPTRNPQPTERILEVEFYPAVEDFVHIATSISGKVPTKSVALYAYYVFLFLNTIVFPVFLWSYDYFLFGMGVLLVNLGALLFIVPRANSDGYRKHYQHLIGNREQFVAKVELSDVGLRYSADDGESFWPWKRITSLEETNESIYFYFDGNGFAVRKSGFAYPEDAAVFVAFANEKMKESRLRQLEAE